MPKPHPLTPERLGSVTADLEALVRRHDPEWTGAIGGDPGITLLELMDWLGDGLTVYRANATRFDPYRNFKFRVKWDGSYVSGVSRVSGLGRVVQATEYREGSEPNVVHKTPGMTTHEPITLERGISHDTAFEDWAKLVKPAAAGAGGARGSHLKTIRIEVLSPAGVPVIAYDVYHCWPMVYRPLPELVEGVPTRLIESLTLVHDGWERDPAVVYPV
ncbi:MAG TPA: phage tail protein [Gemmatimonadales bacterium]|nr:phage tail protein [Gemmatimonadales bacterium]